MVKVILLLFLFNQYVLAESPITKFENSSVQDKDFLVNAFEAGKWYLNQGVPEKSIAITQFYRSSFLASPESKKQFFQESFYQLEVIALSKFCQWGHIEKVLAEYNEALSFLNHTDDKYQDLKKQVAQSKILQETVKENEDKNQVKTISFKTHALYKVSHETLAHASHPKYFILKLENKCKKRF